MKVITSTKLTAQRKAYGSAFECVAILYANLSSLQDTNTQKKKRE